MTDLKEIRQQATGVIKSIDDFVINAEAGIANKQKELDAKIKQFSLLKAKEEELSKREVTINKQDEALNKQREGLAVKEKKIESLEAKWNDKITKANAILNE